MDIIKSQRVNDLLDLYRNLLTDKQVEVMDLYYGYDLSLSEIANEVNTSRSAVFDLIKRSTKILEEYEKKLLLLKKKEEVLALIKDEKLKEKIKEIL